MITRKLLLVSSFFVALSLIMLIIFSNVRYEVTLSVNQNNFKVEVADTAYLLQKGLSGHAPLGTNEGMFFVFGTPDKYGIWMKDMLFAIDIIWIDEDFKVVHIEKNISPDTYPTIFYPNIPAKYVLEVSAGQSEAVNLKIGDSVKISKKWL